MLLIDDILMSPCKGLLWVFEEIHKTAVGELDGEAERIRNELTDLYMMLETEQIAEAEFDLREAALLDRLDQLEAEGYVETDDAAEDADDADDRDDADADADVGITAERRVLDLDLDPRRTVALDHALESEE
ncbi:gas vesicle protein GvpG [Thiohalocapsa sp. ML1]|jgi:hypothetical protein|uniref:gas vesicle protein GvpG n=1 Tax=Thiohalocapsa sp. ML1 TaxID=1431688 RepID=UPI0007323019|nr:gas vesicle protein GvpG [Thiohalocapsa sp. ML1]